MSMHSRGVCLAMLLLTGVTLSGCAMRQQAPDVPTQAHAGPYADGRSHEETVRYNGRDYRVTLRRLPASDIFAITVAAPHRALGGTPGDLRIVRQAALSTLRHYVCREGRNAEALPGTAHHEKGRWMMRARCL